MKRLKSILNSKKGFVLLYAILIMSMLLALTLSITDLTMKERKLSRFGEESFSAFFAAESGMECALYWDMIDDKSWFRHDPINEPGGRIITCNGKDFLVGISDVTEITLVFPGSSNSSVIKVDKDTVEESTSLVVSGYSVADPTSGEGIERGLQIKYGDEVNESDEDCTFDLVFVLDNSSSIKGANQGLLKEAAKKVVNKDENELAEDKFKMSVVSFGYGADLETGLTIEKDDILNAIDSLMFPGWTNIEAGLFIAQEEFLSSRVRDSAPDIIVIVTDGNTNHCINEKDKYDHDTDSSVHRNNDGDCAYAFDCADSIAQDTAEAVAAELHGQNVTIVAVGVGVTPTYANFLKQKIADKPQNYEKVENFDDLDNIFDKFDCSYFIRAVSGLERDYF